jgi:hypothetical protein
MHHGLSIFGFRGQSQFGTCRLVWQDVQLLNEEHVLQDDEHAN